MNIYDIIETNGVYTLKEVGEYLGNKYLHNYTIEYYCKNDSYTLYILVNGEIQISINIYKDNYIDINTNIPPNANRIKSKLISYIIYKKRKNVLDELL